MRQAYGASASDIITVLFALGQWPLSDSDPDAVVTDIETVIQMLNGLIVFGSEPDGRTAYAQRSDAHEPA